jgi:aspartyl-tRNA(Asn)/glutamyl-tRNA(Gln) amidotransferase subunit B
MLKGSAEYGTRCEVKNMNSLRNVQRAIEHEAERQIEIIEAGGIIEQETRNFDAATGTTSLLRSKENAHDYRYFPEPDLPPLKVTKEVVSKIKSELPPLPAALLQKYISQLGLSEYDAKLITEDKAIAMYFEDLIKLTSNYKAAANWLMGDIKSYLNQNGIDISSFPLAPDSIVALISLIESGKVSNSVASQNIFPAMITQPSQTPLAIAESLNLIQESNEDSLQAWAQHALDTYPDKVAAYKAGNKGLLGLFMGEVMKLSNRKADPKATSNIIKRLLES